MRRWLLLVLASYAAVPGCGRSVAPRAHDTSEEIVTEMITGFCAQRDDGAWLLLDPLGSFDSRALQAVLSAHPDQVSEQERFALLRADYRLIRDLAPWSQACVRGDHRRAMDFLSALTNDPVAAWRDLKEKEPAFRGTVRPSWFIHDRSAGLAAVCYTIGTGPLGMEERVVVLRARGSSWAVVFEQVVVQS